MKLKKHFVYVLLFSQIFLFGCTYKYINELSRYPASSFNQINNKTATIIGFDDVIFQDYENTFNKMYPERIDFIDYFTNMFSEKLKTEGTFKFTNYNIIQNKNKPEIIAIDSIYTHTNSDYLISITNIEFSSRVNTVFHPNNVAQTIETCVLKARYKVYDIKEQVIVLDYVSTGEKTVNFFSYKAALEKAIEESINHSVSYIKTGKTEY